MTDKPNNSTGYPALDSQVQALIDSGWTYEGLKTNEGRVILLTQGDERVKLNVAVATTLGLSTIGGLKGVIAATVPKMTFERRNRMGDWGPAEIPPPK